MKKKTIAALAALGAVLGAAAAAGIITAGKRRQQLLNGGRDKSLPPKRNVYFAGGGLAALSGAYYLIRDCKIPGDSIYIFEASGNIGGAFNFGGDSETGYVCTTPKLLSPSNHSNIEDMLKGLQSANIDNMSVRDEIMNYMFANPASDGARLIDADKNAVRSGYGVSKTALKLIKALLGTRDHMISGISIAEYFIETPDFLNSNLWAILSAAYRIRETSSVLELKHILNCISGEITELFTQKNIVRSQLNLQETIISALKAYLEAHNVNIATHCEVTDADFDDETGRVNAIHLDDNGTLKTFYLNAKDLFFVTNGSISECATTGSYDQPAPVAETAPASAALWTRLSEKRDGFGEPLTFYSDSDSEVISFTITSKSRLLLDKLNEISGNTTASGSLMTFKDSPWGLTISTLPQPYFSSQADDITVICGYGIYTKEKGKYTDKEMCYSSGAEILFELVKHIGIEDMWDEITKDIVNVIPCAMPYATAAALPYYDDGKPIIVKDSCANMAFIGQFAKLGAGISNSSEYAVRTAREAAYRLTGTKKSSTPPPKAMMGAYLMLKSLKK